MQRILLKNCRLVPRLCEGLPGGDSGTLYDICIHHAKIEELRPAGAIIPSSGASVLDVRGCTVTPGFMDIHAHLFSLSSTANTDITGYAFDKKLFRFYDFAKTYLKHGYTLIRDVGTMDNLAIYIRNAINEGYLVGPHILASGLILTPTETGNDSFPMLYREVDSPDEVRKACREELKKGADFIKYMGTGAFLNENGNPSQLIASREELKAAVEATNAKGTYVAVHCHGAGAIKTCAELGVRTIEHGSFVDAEGISLLGEKETYLVPTISICDIILENAEGVMAHAVKKRHLCLKAFECLQAAYRAGLKLGFGSDIMMDAFVSSPGLEFTARKKHLHMDNIDILLQATRYSAEILGVDDRMGSIAKGKLANLVVIEGNPDEDMDVLTKLPRHVFKEGCLVE